jgi:RHS repeat-associated protein
VVERDHPQTTINQTYIAQPGQPQTGDAGDKYVGLDRFGRVVDQNWVNATTGQSTDRFQYGYNQNGDVLYRQNLVNATMSELYQYDNLHQLISFQRGTLNATHNGIVGSPSRSQSWSPDALGNFNSVTTNGTTQTRTANQQNEITSISGAGAVTYDANGNLTADGSGNTYVYDAWNRLVAINNGGTTVASYKYDGLGQRITEIHGSNTRELYYSAQGQVLAERNKGLLQARNVWSPVYVNALAYRDQARLNNGVLNDRFLVQQDADWNVTALVNPAGTILERYAYDPFGAVTVLNSNFTVRGTSNYNVPYGFQDMRYDWAVSVNIADNRVYSPTLMRWLQTDPIGLIAGNNDYAFVGNGPADTVDPTGLEPPAAYGNNYMPSRAQLLRRGRISRQNSPINDGARIETVPDWQLRALEHWRVYRERKKAMAEAGTPEWLLDLAHVGDWLVFTAKQAREEGILAEMWYTLGGAAGARAQARASVGMRGAQRLQQKRWEAVEAARSPAYTRYRVAPEPIPPGPRGLAGRARLPGEVPLGSPMVEGHHNALVAIVDETGGIREVRQLTSMGQTQFEAMWPKWKGLSSHTEARAAARMPLKPGEKMVILGQDPPCSSCKGYMNRAATVYDADILYQWWENGKLRTWNATRGK